MMVTLAVIGAGNRGGGYVRHARQEVLPHFKIIHPLVADSCPVTNVRGQYA
jgi:hypothetical protein